MRRIRPAGLIGCAALIAACAQSQPPQEIPVAAHVMISRVISEDIPPRPPDCAIETLTAMPTQPYREVGDIELSEADPAQPSTRAIIDQHACAMGADAVVMTPVQASLGGLIDATAIAYPSKLADRAAQARSAGAAEDRGSTPQLQGPAPAELPMSAGDESSSSEGSEQPGSSDAAGAEREHTILRPVAAAASAGTPITPQATPTPVPASAALAAPMPAVKPSPAPVASATERPAPAAMATATPEPTPAGSSSQPASATP